ncbi:hypothetical protein, partial [Candidatus Magnetobacterium casense]
MTGIMHYKIMPIDNTRTPGINQHRRRRKQGLTHNRTGNPIIKRHVRRSNTNPDSTDICTSFLPRQRATINS